MFRFMTVLALIVTSASVWAGEWTVDLRHQMGPIRDQGLASWCYAFTASDLINQAMVREGLKKVSSVDDSISAAAIALISEDEKTNASIVKSQLRNKLKTRVTSLYQLTQSLSYFLDSDSEAKAEVKVLNSASAAKPLLHIFKPSLQRPRHELWQKMLVEVKTKRKLYLNAFKLSPQVDTRHSDLNWHHLHSSDESIQTSALELELKWVKRRHDYINQLVTEYEREELGVVGHFPFVAETGGFVNQSLANIKRYQSGERFCSEKNVRSEKLTVYDTSGVSSELDYDAFSTFIQRHFGVEDRTYLNAENKLNIAHLLQGVFPNETYRDIENFMDTDDYHELSDKLLTAPSVYNEEEFVKASVMMGSPVYAQLPYLGLFKAELYKELSNLKSPILKLLDRNCGSSHLRLSEFMETLGLKSDNWGDLSKQSQKQLFGFVRDILDKEAIVAISFDARIFNPPQMRSKREIGHAVSLVGYKKEAQTYYYLLRNSWGPDSCQVGLDRFQEHQLQAPYDCTSDGYYVVSEDFINQDIDYIDWILMDQG